MSTGSDYPDFLRVDQWVGAPLLIGHQAGVVNGQVFGPFFVAPWEAVSFRILQSGGAASPIQITFNFYDSIGGNLVNDIVYSMQVGGTMVDVIPVQSLYMTIVVSGMGGARDIDFIVIPRRGFDPASRMDRGVSLLTIFPTNVAAGVTFTQIIPVVMAAHCSFTVYSSAAVWEAELDAQFPGGGFLSRNAYVGSGNGRVANTTPVDLTPNTHQFLFTNKDAVLQSFTAALVQQRV